MLLRNSHFYYSEKIVNMDYRSVVSREKGVGVRQAGKVGTNAR